jgi:hypothetical protein
VVEGLPFAREVVAAGWLWGNSLARNPGSKLVVSSAMGGYGSETGPLAVSTYWIAVGVPLDPGWSLDGHLPLTSG